ncbi:CBS domain-containing protein [Streptomyces botrytidirepellens]|uniref:restriction system modified-DNA reader domain-containing protein n=1 Tax=Streptomyces botrytidirepellens TaxID=2486417 RepID=UPI0016221C15|nr:CBS domain-containing protein [Streptomyces botrytidirepellens]
MNEAAEGPRPSAHPYLLDGRRVRIADLLAAGLLTDRQPLTFARKKKGERHQAEVTHEQGGAIRLLPSGRIYRSPSTAAHVAVGYGSFDGWTAWQLDGGRDLDSVRQQLLDQAVEESAQTPSEDEDAGDEPTTAALSEKERHLRLRAARQAAAENRPQTLLVRELLGWWGEYGRGVVTEKIETALANHSLVTVPPFTQVSLDTAVQLQRAPVEEAPGDGAPARDDLDGDEERPVREPGPTVGTIVSAMGEVVSVSPQATLENAVTLLLLNDFSQLPVIAGRQLKGAVTWKSIAQARHRKADCTLIDAVVDAREVRFDHDLVDVLPVLADTDFLLVRGARGEIGILTVADVALAYGTQATPFLLIGELDRRLRAVITDRFDLVDVTAVCDRDGSRRLTSFDQLTFGDYLSVLGNRQRWEELGWPLDRVAFTKRLDEVRKIRNDLMHFNPDPLPHNAEAKVRGVISILRQYADC